MAYLIDFKQYFAAELRQLEPLVESGLVQLESDGVRVTGGVVLLCVPIAMVFDRFAGGSNCERFSRII